MTTSIQAPIINFRKMKQDFAQNVLRDGKMLFDKKVVLGAKVVDIGVKSIKVHAKVQGAYANSYECDLEIDRSESVILDASCDCPHNFDCQHIACVLFHLENEMENLLVGFSKERKSSGEVKGGGAKSQTSKSQAEKKSVAEEAAVHDVLRHAEKKVQEKQERELEKHLLHEYLSAAHVLGKSPFFIPEEELGKDLGELLFLFQPHEANPGKLYELQIILRLPFRSKPFYIQQAKQFLTAVQSEEPFIIGQNRHVFGIDSFGPLSQDLLKAICQYVHFSDAKSEKGAKVACLDREGLGEFLTVAFEKSSRDLQRHFDDGRSFCLPNIFWGSIEKPMRFCEERATLSFKLDLMKEPKPHVVMSPKVIFPDQAPMEMSQVHFLECSHPGVFFDGCYLRFNDELKRQHLHELGEIEKMSIPEALFGSFVENALPELHRIAKIENPELLDQLVTYPHPDDLKAVCDLHYAAGELEARLAFVYGSVIIPEAPQQFTVDHIKSFVTEQGVLARNLCEENALVRELFHGFLRDEKQGIYVAKTEKKIVEFMTEVIPGNSHKVSFSCPENLLNQFSYDDTTLSVSLSEGSSFDKIKLQIRVDGILNGISCDYLWDCVSARKPYVVLAKSFAKGAKAGGKDSSKFIREESDDEVLQPTQKILVIKLALWEKLLHIFDELELKRVEDVVCEIPLWLLLNLPKERFDGLPVTYEVSKRLSEIQRQLFSMGTIEVPAIPSEIKAELRHYQLEGVNWLSRLRHMGLNGILADDMGLGKTLQTICAITHYVASHSAQAEGSKNQKGEDKGLFSKNLFPNTALIVCPTSLVDNWKEEFSKFNPGLRVATLSGTPQDRKKLLQQAATYDVLITSYGLVQKDIEQYEKLAFSYLILDEAQYIKNRETRNARSVKKIPARHRLILTGTPLENSLADLWSLFDFLMPGLLGSFERFSEAYIRPTGKQLKENLTALQKKIAPFVLRRMKQDVLKDLPPISHIVYHCHLTESQEELYRSYVKSARDELIKLVEREGYEKVKLHVLATLTRLKQICCHPAIFAKDKAAPGDSAKYEMFLDLLGNLIESKRKTVVFSQYTAMLAIMKEDLKKMNAQLVYLDGATKNRMSLVKQFNEDPNTTIFLVSLKAGGNGLNLVGADTVIHYDMWWNPAVENQATARVWRMGQKQPVSSYKLVTSNTVEEKIIALQEKKKELLHDIVRTDEEVISKLSWDEVLELLKT